MSTLTTRRRIVPPRESDSWEDWRRVHNLDLPDLSPAQLEYEAWWAGQLVARDPRRLVWRGLEHVSVGSWASERILAIHRLLKAGVT